MTLQELEKKCKKNTSKEMQTLVDTAIADLKKQRQIPQEFLYIPMMKS